MNKRSGKNRDKNSGEGEELHGPYWLRAHKDWRFLTVVFLMLAAIAAYVITSDLAWRPGSHGAVSPLVPR